ncbi:MAG: protease modulator HflC [Pseudomonadota bacterium]
MNRLVIPAAIFALFAIVIVYNLFLFSVGERAQGIVLRFGDPIRVEGDAGLKFKLPVENVVMLDKRNLEYDNPPLEVFTVNQERLVVDAFVRYQIVDPLRYYESFRGSGGSDVNSLRSAAESRIAAVLETGLRAVLGDATDIEIIRDNRSELMDRINAVMAEEVRQFGVSVIDVKIRRADFPKENEDDVFERMRSERIQIAQRIRAEGDEQAQRIRAQADRRVTEIVADANRRALEIQGRADAARNCIFAGAYDGVPVRISEEELQAQVEDAALPEDSSLGAADGDAPEPGSAAAAAVITAAAATTREANAAIIDCEFLAGGQRDPQRAEFFAFDRSLDAYEAALKKGETTILLSPDSEFFRYFKDFSPRN